MWVFALAATLLSAAFAVALARRWMDQRRPFLLLWTVALVMYALSSAAVCVGMLGEWSAPIFRIYWLFGAILNVPYLAQGELSLLAKRPAVVRGWLAVLLVATAVATVAVFAAPVELEPGRTLPLGKDTFGSDALAYRLAQLLAYPAYLYLGAGSIWSAVRMRGRPALRNRAVGTILVAVGATIVAVGSGVGAGLDVAWLFVTGLAAGVAVMFWGFLRASRPA